jgi:hypothetical protein
MEKHLVLEELNFKVKEIQRNQSKKTYKCFIVGMF